MFLLRHYHFTIVYDSIITLCCFKSRKTLNGHMCKQNIFSCNITLCNIMKLSIREAPAFHWTIEKCLIVHEL